jgi:hypothetical protein
MGCDLGETFLTNMAYNIRPMVSMTTHQPRLSIRKLVQRIVQAGEFGQHTQVYIDPVFLTTFWWKKKQTHHIGLNVIISISNIPFLLILSFS